MDHPSSDTLPSPFDDFSVILVEPEDNANIGAVARAMKNTGFSELTLVAPPRFEIDRAAVTACWARDLLERVKMTDKLEAAVAYCDDVVGFSAREGKNRPLLTLDEWLRKAGEGLSRRTALVFGPEETGLHADHITHCRWLVRIPSRAECPSYNLAQAVLIVLHEISKLSIASPPAQESRVPWAEYEHLDSLVHRTLHECGFYNEGTPPRLPDTVANLFRRVLPNEREMKILQGIFGRILKKFEGRR